MLVLFLLLAFRSGSDRFYLKRAAGIRSNGRDVLYFLRFRNALRLITFYLCFYSMKLLVMLVSYLPFLISAAYAFYFLSGERASSIVFAFLFVFSLCLFVHGTIFFFRFNSFFFASRYCFVTERFQKMRELFRFAFLCMQGERRRLFYKRLSFIPWFFSCVFLLPISFVRSYYNQSMAYLAADLIEKHLQKQ